MTTSESERAKIIEDYQKQEAEKLRKRMSEIGKKRSPAKRKSTLRNRKKATAALKRLLKDPEWRKKRWPSKKPVEP